MGSYDSIEVSDESPRKMMIDLEGLKVLPKVFSPVKIGWGINCSRGQELIFYQERKSQKLIWRIKNDLIDI